MIRSGRKSSSAGRTRDRKASRNMSLPVLRRQRRVDDVAGAGLVLGAGAGIERHLVRRAVEHATDRPRRCPACRCRDARPSRRWRRARRRAAVCAWRAAIAALLNRQKPIAVVFSAWWPGGRAATKTLSARAGKHVVDRGIGGADRRQRRLPALRADGGVGVDARDPVVGDRPRMPSRRRLAGWA